MEYVYAAMLLHSAKKEITEENVSGILKAAGVSADSARVKALCASLKDVNIDDAIAKASTMAVAAAPAAAAPAVASEAKAKPKAEEAAKTEEEAAAGLAGLFG